MTKIDLKKIRTVDITELWDGYSIGNASQQAIYLMEIERRKFISGKTTVKEIMTNQELFLKYIQKKEEDQNSIGNSLKSSTFVDDSFGVFLAVNFKIQKKGTRLAKNGTIKKVLGFMANDDREGFDDYWNSRARSGTHTVYTTDEIETYDAEVLYSPSAEEDMFTRIEEEEAARLEALRELQDLENLVDAKLAEIPKIGLFDAEELENEFVKAGNKFPKKVKKIIENDDLGLFDEMGV